MEVSKRNSIDSKTEKNLSESETNGEKTTSESEETISEEVLESESLNEKSGEDETNSDEKDANKLNEEDNDKWNENGSENKPEKKNLKRKITEVLKEVKNEQNNLEETIGSPKEIIEDENPQKKLKKADDKDSSISLPVNDVFGKGKRARIPNKRYSDIAISPSINKTPKSFIENGERERVTLIDRMESELADTSSPVPKRVKTSSVDLGNPNFLKPFKLGWKRELVWRAIGGDIAGKRNGDIYYYSPEGKKLRSMREVAEHLNATTKDLTVEDFTFFKEPLGLNDPEKEVIRDAKIKSAGINLVTVKKASTLKQKKIFSPKVSSPKVMSPKISSPKLEPASASSTPKVTSPRPNSAKSDKEEETKTTKSTRKTPLTPKASDATDSGNEGKKTKSPPLKVKLNTKPKGDKKQTGQNKTVASTSEESSPMAGKKATPRKLGKWSQKPVTSESSPKSNAGSKKKTIKLNNITNQSNDKIGETQFMGNYLQNLSYGYNTLLHVFQYLKVQDLLRAGCVCTMWRDIASHPSLWRTVRMKNSQVHSFEGLANTLQKHGTVQLDLRKMLLTNCDDIWPEFSSNIGKVDTLRKIELCRCPASVVEKLTETNPKLEVVNAVTIRCETMNLEGLENWNNLRELRLKSTTGLTLKSDIESLKALVNLKILSLTSIRDLNTMKLEVIAELTNLECLDLGECTDFPENFGKDILSKLTKLEKLRLEKGQGNCHTFEIFEAVKDMKHLEQLELVNFDIKSGFDKALGACKNVKKLLIIPTYISQSATTNHMVLGGVLRLQKSLSHFVWGVTLELLRVTELFVDQCEEPEKKEKKEKKVVGNGDSIPVLKPVPLISEDNSDIPPALDPPQVEILALPGLQKLLLQSLPSTRVKILKIPFHATWRQTITDAVN